MIVTEIRQWRIDAESKEEALAKRKSGEGELIHSQDVANDMNARTKLVPFDQWPLWAKAMRQFSKPEDNGIGDTVARMIGDEKSEAFKLWFEATFKKKCGCSGRQATWNILYPLR